MLFTLFSPEKGLAVLHKRGSKKNTSRFPDIFDEVNIFSEQAKASELRFISDFELISKPEKLAFIYENFEAACKLSKFIKKNIKYLENFEEVYSLFSSALNALNEGSNASLVLIKFFYLFAKKEGYPIKESFAKSLNSEHLETLSLVLKQSAKDCTVSRQKSLEILKFLEVWLFSETDFVKE